MSAMPRRCLDAVSRWGARSLVAVVAGTVTLGWGPGGVPVAVAQSPAADRARELAEVGARAQALGHYDFAIHAFTEAHQLSRRDGLLYSIAQAHRQRYALERKPTDLVLAVAHLRRYLQVAPTGEHHGEAQRALAELEQVLAGASIGPGRLAAGGDEDAAAEAAAQQAVKSRLAVMSSALGAVVRIDGGPARSAPVFVEVTPGKHTVTVQAPGYLEQAQGIWVPKGSVHTTTIQLEPQPAKLTLDAPSGATVHVDGKRVGTTPLAKPIALDPGKHFVAIVKTGFAAYSRELALERGKATKLTVELKATSQRAAAWAFIGAGGVGVGAGVVLGVLSIVEHRKARDLEREADGAELSAEDERVRRDALSARDDLRVGSGIAAGTGLGCFVLGGALLVLDTPAVPRRGGDVAARPVVGPGLTGGSMTVRF